ncbi:MAG: exosortase/archaeosortase family protein, partial [Planctomycetota bacterium]
LRQAGAYYGVATAERCALWVALVGVLLMAAGSVVVRRAVWLLAFLLLMIPPPARLHEAIALPLQRLASGLTTAALELLGFYAQCEGNVIRLEDQTALNVAEACSGLRLLTAFVFVAALLAFLVRRPAWQKAVLLAASLPIAVLCNAARGVATALFAHYSPSAGLTGAFHDAAGLAMMPVALFLSLALFRYLALFTPARKPAAAAPGRDGNGPLRRAS